MKTSTVTRLVSLIMSIVMAVMALPLQAFATSEEAAAEEEYISSIKLATSSDRDKAKRELEDAGYVFLDANLNEGATGDGVYLGYTTTTDPTRAIYDMKLMNMKGGFTLTSTKKALEAHKDTIAQMATDLMYLTDEFAEAYGDGSEAAKNAYMALNLFRMSESDEGMPEENGLGYQLAHKNISRDRLMEIILFCDPVILDSVIQILTMGIQARGESWVKELSQLGPYDADEDYCDDERELQRRAEQLLPILKLYAQAYNAMEQTGIVSGTFNENMELEGQTLSPAYDLEAADAEVKNAELPKYQLYKIAFDYLAEFSYGTGGTLKDFICSLEDSDNYKQLYPLVSVLSDGEFAAMSYGCVIDMILGAGCDQSSFDGYADFYSKATEEQNSVYLYLGVDRALAEDDTVIAFTDEASRHIAATGEMEFYENESWADDVRERGRTTAKLVAAGCMALMGLARIIISVTMFATWTFSTAELVAIGGKLGVFMKYCAVACHPYAMLVVIAIAVVVAGIFYLVAAIDEWKNGLIKWDENPIPAYIYDVTEVTVRQSTSENVATEYTRTPTFMYYEGVTDLDGEMVDLNARSGAAEWLALYVSRDAIGEGAAPIKAGELMVRTGNGQTPEGYAPVTEFGEVGAKDLNSYDEKNSVNGVYMFYGKAAEVPVDTGRTYYISDIYLQSGKSTEHCIGLLEAAGYTPINVNLTPSYHESGWFIGDDIYSYVGYKVTTNKNSALRDIRMCYGTGTSPYHFGGATYAECGSGGGVTLYATKFASAGTPILAGGLIVTETREEAPAGYEPVNLFSGGPAMTINTDTGDIRGYHFKIPEYYLYFLPEVSFTEGEEYLGGVAFLHTSDGMLTHTLSNLSYDEDKQLIKLKLLELTGKDYPIETEAERVAAMTDYLLYRSGYHGYVSAGGSISDSFLYYRTYNPYRAVYNMKATSYSDVPTEMASEGTNYVSAPTLHYREDPSFAAIRPMDRPSTLEMDLLLNDPAAALAARLYVTGNPSGNVYSADKQAMSSTSPVKLSEFLCLPQNAPAESFPGEESGLDSLTDIYGTEKTQVLLRHKDSKTGYYIYLPSAEEKDTTYVSGIYVTDTASIFRLYGGAASGVTSEMITRGIAMSILGNSGATRFCSAETDMYGWAENGTVGNSGLSLHKANTLYYGYSKTDKKSAGYTDIVLVYGGLTNEAPEDKLYKGSVRYDYVCEISAYNISGMSNAIVPRVYLYATTDKDAGERIIDFTVSSSPFKAGYQTVRTMDGGSVRQEIVEHLEAEVKLQTLSMGEYAIKNWLTFFKNHDDTSKKDCNGAFYLHFLREGASPEEAKPYISDIYVANTGDNEATAREELFAQGADYYLKKDLNAGAWSDVSVYIGYKRTGSVDDAVTNILASHEKSHPQTKKDKNGVVYTLAGDVDLNEDCGFWSDYIYLYYTKDRGAGDPIHSISTSNKVMSGGITEDVEGGYLYLKGTLSTVKKMNSSTPSDLNEDAGGEYIYLVMERENKAFFTDYPDSADYGRNRTYTRKTVTGKAEGQYVAELFVMDKNTLRQEKLANGAKSSDCKCSSIPDSEVIQRLFDMGAVTVIETPILTVGSKYSGFAESNGNKVFIGYNYTDVLRDAVKDIVLYADPITADGPEETVYVDKKSYKLVAPAAAKVEELPPAVNLIGLEDREDGLFPTVYLYASYSGTDPVYDIRIDTEPILEGWSTALSQEGKDVFTTLSELAGEFREEMKKESDAPFGPYNFSHRYMGNLVNSYRVIFDPKKPQTSLWYVHTKHYAGDSVTEALPYIDEVYLATGDTKHEALAALLANDPNGYADCNLNKDAGGKYVYVGYTRVDGTDSREKPVTAITVLSGTDPRRVISTTGGTGGTGKIRYEIVSYSSLNEGAGGRSIYLYTTEDTSAGVPLTQLRVTADAASAANGDGYTESVVKRTDGTSVSDTAADLNEGINNKSLYMITRGLLPKEEESGFPAALIVNGSLWAVAAFVIVGAGAAFFAVKKKRSTDNK